MSEYTFTLKNLPENVKDILLQTYAVKNIDEHRKNRKNKNQKNSSTDLFAMFEADVPGEEFDEDLQVEIDSSQIIWATDNYEDKGEGYGFLDPVNDLSIIVPRVDKSKAEQKRRSKEKAEVFTPSWVCNVQNNLIDENVLYEGVFNTTEDEGRKWVPSSEKVKFNKKYSWLDYVVERRIEFTCVDKETEYWNGLEWKKISHYEDGEQVLQYNPDGTAELVTPLKYHYYTNDKPFYFYKSRTFETMLTGDHRVIYKDYKNRLSECSMQDVVDKWEIDHLGHRGKIPRAFEWYGNEKIDEFVLRLMIAVQADGSLKQGSKRYYQMKLKKTRKIERMQWILDNLDIKYTKTKTWIKNRGEYTVFRFNTPMDFEDNKLKIFPKQWLNLDKKSKEIFIDEVFHWDGTFEEETTKGKNSTYYSNSLVNIELVQMILCSSNIASSIHKDIREGKNVSYKVIKRKNNVSSYLNTSGSILTKHYDREKYCFTVPSGMLVLRRNKKIFVTGNCGEAPYLMSPYDTTTGEGIPVRDEEGRFARIGLLDRKLRVISENVKKDEWDNYALLALIHTFGYEWQGDNLLLARLNFINTFIEYRMDAVGEMPDDELLSDVAEIAAWNIWQMDGLKMVEPMTCSDDCQACKKKKRAGHNGKVSAIRFLGSKGFVQRAFEDMLPDEMFA